MYFWVGTPGKKKIMEVIRDNNLYYRVEEEEKLVPLGDMLQTVRLLAQSNGEVAVKKGNHYKNRPMFFNREAALSMMRDGFAVVSLDMGTSLVYDKAYTRIISSNGQNVEEDTLPPGQYCLALNEDRLKMTLKEVKAEKLAAAKKASEQPKKVEKTAPEINKPPKQCPATLVKQDSQNWKFWTGAGVGAIVGVVISAVYRHFRTAS